MHVGICELTSMVGKVLVFRIREQWNTGGVKGPWMLLYMSWPADIDGRVGDSSMPKVGSNGCGGLWSWSRFWIISPEHHIILIILIWISELELSKLGQSTVCSGCSASAEHNLVVAPTPVPDSLALINVYAQPYFFPSFYFSALVLLFRVTTKR